MNKLRLANDVASFSLDGQLKLYFI